MMPDLNVCEKLLPDVDAFLLEVAQASAEIIGQSIPLEYRSVYLGAYAAGLALNTQGVNYE